MRPFGLSPRHNHPFKKPTLILALVLPLAPPATSKYNRRNEEVSVGASRPPWSISEAITPAASPKGETTTHAHFSGYSGARAWRPRWAREIRVETNEFNKEIYEVFNRIYRNKHRRCLFADECTEEAVEAHSVSRAVLATIGHNGHVIAPMGRHEKDVEGRTGLDLGFDFKGIGVASTGTFACRTHENAFKAIDTVPMDFNDPHIRNLLLYRAVLHEIWTLSRIRPGTDWIEERVPDMLIPSIHPDMRLQSLLYMRDRIRALVTEGNQAKHASQVVHKVRRVKSNHPIVAVSSASGGSMLAFDHSRGEALPTSSLRERGGFEPYTCWGLTIIPHDDAHMVLASWLDGSPAATYFKHLEEVQGKELEAAVSAELILFCENWFLSPQVWNGYGQKRRQAILNAYDNILELVSGQYPWMDRSDRTPWHKYVKLPNRHQINVFRYDQSAFKPQGRGKADPTVGPTRTGVSVR